MHAIKICINLLTNWKTPLVTVQLKSLKRYKDKIYRHKKKSVTHSDRQHKEKCDQWFRFCDYTSCASL